MAYTLGQLSKIKQKIISKLSSELDLANEEGNVQDVLDKYGIVFEEDYVPVNTRTMKVLVVGALAGSLKDYQIQAKKIGVDPDNIEFECDYDKLKRFDANRLKDSFEYSDIIYGPNPHKQVNTDGFSSMLSMFKETPERFPRVIVAGDSHGLKISISVFKECFLKTRYFESLN